MIVTVFHGSVATELLCLNRSVAEKEDRQGRFGSFKKTKAIHKA